MSYTTLLGIESDGDVEEIEKYQNSHGAAMYVWRILFTVRRGLGFLEWMNPDAGYISSSFIPKCTDEEAWVLGMTLDSCIISRESAPLAAKYLRIFLEGPGQEPKHVNHWPAIMKVLENMPEQYSGIAINQTSLGDSALQSGVEEGEDGADWRPYNIYTDEKHFFLDEKIIKEWREEKADEPG